MEMESGFDEIVGTSCQSDVFRRFIGAAAQTSKPVVLLGEPGVGKAFGARSIHAHSGRRNEPFLVVDCSLYFDRELKREVFGYRGSGPSAKERRGLLEYATRGTCYLSRIEELSPGLQECLLEFLQRRRFRRLGDGREIPSDTRLIVSSDKNLRGFVEGGLFSAELYDELCGHAIEVPPLRARSGDIALILDELVEGRCREAGRVETRPHFSADAVSALSCYPWPGNVDELSREVDRAFESGAHEVTADQLSLEIRSYWIGRQGDPAVRRVLEELDGYIREFRVLSRLDAEFGDVLMNLDGWDDAFQRAPRQLGEQFL